MIYQVIALVAIICSIASLIIACIGLSIIVGLKNSTHQIEWMPVPEPQVDQTGEDGNNKKNASDVVDSAVDEFQKLYPDIDLDQV